MQIPYEVVPTIEPWHHSHDIMSDSEVIKLHAWLLDNVLLDLAHIDLVINIFFNIQIGILRKSTDNKRSIF